MFRGTNLNRHRSRQHTPPRRKNHRDAEESGTECQIDQEPGLKIDKKNTFQPYSKHSAYLSPI
jgi:hypothetical protein